VNVTKAARKIVIVSLSGTAPSLQAELAMRFTELWPKGRDQQFH
jgi:hypothetical protein